MSFVFYWCYYYIKSLLLQTPATAALETNKPEELEPLKKLEEPDVMPPTVHLCSNESETSTARYDVWIMYHKHKCSFADKEIILEGKTLTDIYINFCQAVLKAQFPMVEGLI